MNTSGRIFDADRSTTGIRLAALLAVALLAGGSLARADEDCNKYAQLSAIQLQQNKTKNCGLKGDAWNPNTDKAALIAWCQSVPPDEWRKAISDRDKQLKTCGS